uniref:Uncharacterized protein n=1 Tax=Populus alba TaxID=43335 RepID=A0A4U5N8K5_POPAL|nr:hypothetical protein D5086_0000274870 [Populus alba]
MEVLLWRAVVQRHQETIKILQVGSSSAPLRNQQNLTHGGAIVAGSSSVKPRNQQDLTKEGALMAGSSSVPPQRVLQDSIASHNASLAPIQEGNQPIPGSPPCFRYANLKFSVMPLKMVVEGNAPDRVPSLTRSEILNPASVAYDNQTLFPPTFH